MDSLMDDIRPGRLYRQLSGGRIQCLLCPRHCKMTDGNSGFCRTRMNRDGHLYTLNYGKAVPPAQESIETEAVFHYMPGSPILSLGNIGCNLSCDFCQNWQTSQIEHLDEENIYHCTPEQIIELALSRDIPVLSWTYNDPVVWHEFVMDTARLAKQAGLINLFKSAFFISLDAVEELCEVIDIFSISIKSLNDSYYRKLTKGWLQPVLDAAILAFRSGKHVEISNLIVTDANASEEDGREVAEWVLTNLSDEVPLHYVAFHPAYKYAHVSRTPIECLNRAREVAIEAGIKYCYLGNVFDSEATHTYCPGCGNRIVQRYGLNTQVVGLTPEMRCSSCGHASPIKRLYVEHSTQESGKPDFPADELFIRRRFDWHGEINILHVGIKNETEKPGRLTYKRIGSRTSDNVEIFLSPKQIWRFSVCKSSPDEIGVDLHYPERFRLDLYEVYDRAHYPTVALRN